MLKRLLAVALMALGIGTAEAGNPLTDPNTMMIGVWFQDPLTTNHCGGCGTNLASKAASMGINTWLGLYAGSDWPTGVGTDRGEMAAIKAAALYLIGGITVPYTENTSKHSVSSIIALATAQSALSNLIGYTMYDEPTCSPGTTPAINDIPSVVSAIAGYDPTRIAYFNHLPLAYQPVFYGSTCMTAFSTALSASALASFDLYPATHPYQLGLTGSDWISTPVDSIYRQGLLVTANAHYAPANQPIWAFVESGGDNQGLPQQNNTLSIQTTNGSATIVNNSGESQFTSSWVGLTVSGTGLQASSTISSITDATHAVLNKTATASGTVTGTVTGGTGGGPCVVSVNLCVVHGTRYRPTAAEVNAEVWNSIVSGATGIEWFCHDSTSNSFCLGDSGSGGADATTAASNITYINGVLATYAPMIKSTNTGICSMQTMNYSTQVYSTTSSCTNGVLTLSTSNSAVPGLAKVVSYGSDSYLFVQSDRRSASGATFTVTLSGMGSRSYQLVYDSNSHYDAAHDTTGATGTLSSGVLTTTLGANSNHYQVKIYKILAATSGGGDNGSGGTNGCCHGLRIKAPANDNIVPMRERTASR